MTTHSYNKSVSLKNKPSPGFNWEISNEKYSVEDTYFRAEEETKVGLQCNLNKTCRFGGNNGRASTSKTNLMNTDISVDIIGQSKPTHRHSDINLDNKYQ